MIYNNIYSKFSHFNYSTYTPVEFHYFSNSSNFIVEHSPDGKGPFYELLADRIKLALLNENLLFEEPVKLAIIDI